VLLLKPDTMALLCAAAPVADGWAQVFELVTACMASFPLTEQGGHLLHEARMWQCAERWLPPGTVMDECRPKPRAEFLAYGECRAAPKSGETRAREVDVAVGPLRSRLTVFGDRVWRRGEHSRPEPFLSMPMTWAQAYGGAQTLENPLGKGDGSFGPGPRPLPNVQSRGEYISSPEQRPTSAGLGAVPPGWAPRASLGGTRGRDWFLEQWPGHPADTDPEFFMTAPRGQRLEGFFSGDERIAVQGMHPARELVQGRLPAVRCRVFLLRGEGPDDGFQELQTRRDTLTLFPGEELGVLTFRAVARVRDEDCSDVQALVAVFEPMEQAPQPAAAYRRQALAALQPPPAAPPEAVAAAPADAASASRPMERMPGPHAAAAAAVPDLLELQGVVDEVEAETAALLDRLGLERGEAEAFLHRLQQDEAALFQQAQGAVDAATPADMLRDVARQAEEQARELLRQSGGSEEEIEAFLQQAGSMEEPPPLEEHFAAHLADPGVPEEVKAGIRDMIDSFGAVLGLCARLERLGVSLGGVQAADEPGEPAAEEPEAEPRRLSREQVLALHAEGRSLAGADLSGLDLSGCDLAGCDLRGALLQHASCCGTRLRGATLADADCSGADFSEADLEGATLDRALFARCSLEKASCIDVQARGARFMEAAAAEADFSRAVLDEADFTRAGLQQARFEQAHAPRIRLLGADLKDANLNGAHLYNSRADADTDASGARLQGAEMAFSGWRGARLHGADLTRARLERADLGGCNLQRANLQHAQAPKAKCIRTDLGGADLRGLQLQGGSLRRARLGGARLEGADFQGADLYKCASDPDALLQANLERTILDPAILAWFKEN